MAPRRETREQREARDARLKLVEPPAHGRLWAADRRKQLLAVAADLLTQQGADGVRIPDVAERAGVSRAVVYRFFPNRQAILLDLLEEFGVMLQERVERSLDAAGLADVDALLELLFRDVCETVDDLGAGAWRLLNSTGPDPDVESVARKVRTEVAGPWFARVQEVTGAAERDAFALTAMIAATIPAVVDLWLSGQVERGEAVTTLKRGVAGLIRAFTED
jgi:AcrR family transcriptional regulator